MFIYVLVLIALLSPVVFALPRRAKYPFVMALISCAAVVGIAIGADVLAFGPEAMTLYGLDIVFGQTEIVADELSALFLILISIAAVSVGVYSKGYLSGYLETKSPAHISLHLLALLILCISMMFVVVCRDAYGFLFSWELMTISSFILILFYAEQREVRKAALNYLVLMHIGFVFLLAGFVKISAEGLAPTFDSLAVWFSQNNPLPLFIVFLIGFGMKAGIFPLHTWLPEAHPAAPAHVSAFMSGTMIKMGVYGVIRVMSYVEDEMFTIGIILFVAGILSGLWGAILAAVQSDMKRLLAYSSIENIGIIFIALGISAVGYSLGNDFLALCAMGGALLHTLNHSLFKTLLFFGAGNVFKATHTTSLNSLGGLSRKMPLTAGLFLIGVLAIAALPPLNGFVSEYMIYYGLLDMIGVNDGGIIAGICGIVAMTLIGGIILLAFTKLYGITFLGSPRSHAVDHAEEVDRSSLAACAIPVAGIIAVGLAPYVFTKGIFSISGSVLSISDSHLYYAELGPQTWRIALAAGVLVVSVLLLLLYRRSSLRERTVEKSPVWGCGFTPSSHKMQYTGESYSEGLYGISNSMTKSSGKEDVVGKSEIFPTRHSFEVKHKDKVSTMFSDWWTKGLYKVNVRVMRFNTGKVNHYILYALMFLVLIFSLSVLNLI